MTHSYIDYKEKTVRINDGFLMMIFYFVINLSTRRNNLSPLAMQKIEEWKFNLDYSIPGAIDLNMVGFFESEEGQNLLLSLLSEASDKFRKFGDKVPYSFLNDLTKPEYKVITEYDIKVDDIQREIQKIIGLVDGTGGTKISDLY